MVGGNNEPQRDYTLHLILLIAVLSTKNRTQDNEVTNNIRHNYSCLLLAKNALNFNFVLE